MTERDTRDEVEFVAAQLRHAYQQLIRGDVKNQVAFARGLIGPCVEKLERLLRAPETQERTIKVWNIEEACKPTSPFEYDQGDVLAVYYDDLYDLVHPRTEDR